MYNIPYGDLDGRKFLPDGDIIAIGSQPLMGFVDPNNVGVMLYTAFPRWWKGVQSGTEVLCQIQDDEKPTVAKLPLKTLLTDGLQLWKAKFLGVHTPMYNIEDPASWAQGGMVYFIAWIQDSGPTSE
jgi:hypothetical protein